MIAHWKMDGPDSRRRLDDMSQKLVGTPLDRPEGPLKVCGRAAYAYDAPVPDRAFGVLVRATIARGELVALDSSAVEALPGVVGVFCDPRFLRNPAQGMAGAAPVQGPSTIAYFGQPIALVVATTFEQARHGAQRLAAEGATYEAHDDPAVDPEAEGIEVERPEGEQIEQGDLDRAMRDAAYCVDQEYRTPAHSSAPMEPHAAIAQWADDRLLLHGSYQMLHTTREELADALGIDAERVRILSPYVGGGFGSKLGVGAEAVAAAIAARALGRPVCVALTRPQVFEATTRRSESRQRVRLAADANGVLTGIGHTARVSNLPGESFHEPVTQATHFVYGGENRQIGLELVRLNRTCAGSVRAPGEAVGMQALENAMDELAEAAGIDPVELRKRNLPDRHPEDDRPYSSRLFVEALDEGARRFGWQPRRGRRREPEREGEWRIGTGMAGIARVNQLLGSRARVTLDVDGCARVETDMTDIGTGTYAVLMQIAGEVLGLPPERVAVRLGDTALPASCGSGGSFGASSTGSAVFLACEALRGRLAVRMGCEESSLTLQDGEARMGDRVVPIAALLDRESLSAEGRIEPGKASDAVRQASYGACFVEVGVSAVTGETRVRRMTGVFSAGRILNAKTATSQCHGGLIWGIGLALSEALVFDPRDGHVVNRDLAGYHVPVNLDVPPIDVALLEERDDWASPIQSKGIGELALCGAAAAILNAIHDATGIRIRDYPATPDVLLGVL